MYIVVFLLFFISGSGCIHDREENRFYWFSNRANSEISGVQEQGGPGSYCQSLGKE